MTVWRETPRILVAHPAWTASPVGLLDELAAKFVGHADLPGCNFDRFVTVILIDC
jgi:hypothetical protein